MLTNTQLALILDTLARQLNEGSDDPDIVFEVADTLDALFWLLTANEAPREEVVLN